MYIGLREVIKGVSIGKGRKVGQGNSIRGMDIGLRQVNKEVSIGKGRIVE